MTDPLSNVTTYNYDSNDNLTSTQDALNNVTSFTYDASNHVIIKTLTPGDGSAATTTRYAYTPKGQLRFVVDNDGEVTDYQVNPTTGLTTVKNIYADNTYDLSGLGVNDSIPLGNLADWVTTLGTAGDLATTNRTYYTLISGGNLQTENTFTACDPNTGAGITSDPTKPYTTVTYSYDQYGNLLTRHTSGMSNTEVFTYDGLGRMVTSTDLNGVTSTVSWTDSSNTSTVTLSYRDSQNNPVNGLVTVSAYDKAGDLITTSNSGPDYTGGTASYKYDSLGRLCISTDASGVKSYFLYDNLGRKTADIAADGSITEYRYDSAQPADHDDQLRHPIDLHTAWQLGR